MKIIILLFFYFTILFSFNSVFENKLIYPKSDNSWFDLRNKDLVVQKFDYSCGSASISTIFKYFYLKDISEAEVLNTILDKNSTAQEENGNIMFSFLDLSRVADKKGFKSLSIELDFNTLKKLKIPAIIYVVIRKEPHFTVFKSIDDNHIYLADPSFGNIKISLEKFNEIFSTNKDKGKILLVLPKDKENMNYSFMKVEKNNLLFKNYKNNKFMSEKL